VAGLLFRVKTKMSIFAHRKTLELLEGGYASVHRGRSHDFDDLRAYVAGDEVKDIDWKATARVGEPLIKRYVASRRHHLAILVDTGRNMAATAESGESKKDLAILAAGALASIATAGGDVVSLVVGDEGGIVTFPPGQTDEHLERLLRVIDDRISLTAPPSDVLGLLERAARAVTSRSLVLVVTDDLRLTDDHLRLVRLLGARHEIMWLTIGDADLMRTDAGVRIYDVQELAALPAYVRSNKALRGLFAEAAVSTVAVTERDLRLLGVTSHRIGSETEVVPGLLALVEKQRSARR
jgi:uncharacterized protein (DUF58 family)